MITVTTLDSELTGDHPPGRSERGPLGQRQEDWEPLPSLQNADALPCLQNAGPSSAPSKARGHTATSEPGPRRSQPRGQPPSPREDRHRPALYATHPRNLARASSASCVPHVTDGHGRLPHGSCGDESEPGTWRWLCSTQQNEAGLTQFPPASGGCVGP